MRKMPDHKIQHQTCCQCCVSFIFSLGVTALSLWLSLRPSEPTYSIENFYVPALNTTAASVQDPKTTINTTITFDFRLTNPNKDSKIYHDTLNITVYYGHNLTIPIGNVSIPGFRQGRKKKATKTQNFTAVGVPWNTALEEVSNGKNITVFRVNLETTIRFKTLFVMSKRRIIKVGKNVTVDNRGSKTEKKGVKLSSASVHGFDCVRVGFLLLFVWILF